MDLAKKNFAFKNTRQMCSVDTVSHKNVHMFFCFKKFAFLRNGFNKNESGRITSNYKILIAREMKSAAFESKNVFCVL